MTQTAWVLSLSQFYLSLGFMLLFLALELGLAWVLFGFRLRARRGGAALLAYRFWVRVFALTLVLGFAASLPLMLQLGTLWPHLMDRAGEVIGPLVALAVLTAFVFKSCFLGAMLYGQRSLSNAAHVWVVGMVAVGTSLTAYWIMCLVAWLQWPMGAALVDGRYRVTDWFTVMDGAAPALFGVLLACGLLLAATLMLSVTALRTRTRPSDEGDRRVYAIGLWLVLVAVILQAVMATVLLRQILPVQPGRVAATLPQWDSGPPGRLSWLAWPDEAAGANAWTLQGPAVAPDWLPRTAQGDLRGLKELADTRPPVLATYLLARLSVGLTGALGLMALWGVWRGHRLRHEPDHLSPADRRGLRILVWGAIALQLAGWGYLFVGSLPYAVYGSISLRVLGTAQSENVLWGGFGLQALVYGALALGFRQLLGHTTRYGVVPVARHRGRA